VNPLLILTAVDLEARELAAHLDLPRLPSYPFLAFGRDSVRVAPVGPGASCLQRRWDAACAGLVRPLVVSAGVCGGLDPHLLPGDVVIPERVIEPTGTSYQIRSTYHRAATEAHPAACLGHLITTRHLVASAEAKASLRAQSGAAAVDMESSLIVERAAASGCPSLVVRGISDAAGEGLPPELIRLVGSDGRVMLTRAVALLASRPSLLPRALSLRRQTERALAAVARVLAALAA
jgi:hypothetical protein